MRTSGRPARWLRTIHGLFLSAALAMGALPVVASADAPALSFTSTNGSFIDGTTRMLGWQFSAASPISVTALGWFDLGGNGLASAHQIGIWEKNTQTLVASATVTAGTGDPLSGFFRYSTLASPTTLSAGITYVVAGLDPGNGDAHVWAPATSVFGGPEVNGFAVNPLISLGPAGSAQGGAVGGFQFPSPISGGFERTALMGPNMLITAVPEVPAAVMLAPGLLLVAALARRRRPAQQNASPRR